MFKNAHAAETETNRNHWQMLCAKAGKSDAAHVRPGGTVNECHEKRKVMRQALNAIQSKNPTYDEATTLGIEHAAQVIASLNTMIDDLENHADRSNSAPTMKVMRNKADFEKHYRDGNAFGDDGEFGIADYFRGLANMATTTSVRNALSIGTDTAGGFAVPSRLMPGILSALVPNSALLAAGAGIIAMEEGAKTYTTAGINAIPTAAWRLESGALATSEPTFRSVVATPRSLSFQFKVSRELLADGQNIQEALNQAIAQAFAKELDRAGLRGTGTSPEIRGVLNTAGIQTVTNGTNGASLATLKYANLLSAVQAILAVDAPMPTAAIMSPRSLVGLGSLADSTGQPLRVPDFLTGMKLIGSSQVPNNLTVGSSSDCTEMYIGAFESVHFAMREAVSIQVLHELYAGTGEIGFAAHMRVDMFCNYPQALALVTGVRP